MAFQPGESGNPAGRPPREKSFAAMLKLAINEARAEGGPTALREVAQALVDKARSGDVQAIKEVADRLDGKVPQGIGGAEDLAAIKHQVAGQINLVPVSVRPRD